MVFKIAPISLVGLTIQKTSDTQTQLLCTSSQSDLFQTKISTLGVQSQSLQNVRVFLVSIWMLKYEWNNSFRFEFSHATYHIACLFQVSKFAKVKIRQNPFSLLSNWECRNLAIYIRVAKPRPVWAIHHYGSWEFEKGTAEWKKNFSVVENWMKCNEAVMTYYQ